MAKKASVPSPEDPSVRRSYLSPDKLVDRPQGYGDISTVYDVFPTLAERYGDKHACGYRDVLNTVEEKKEVKGEMKTWKYFTLSDYKYLSYNELFTRVKEIGSGLRHLEIKEGSRVGIYADTSANWQTVAHGCARALLPITTAYPTLGPSGLATSLTEPEVQAVFTNASLLSTLEGVLTKGSAHTSSTPADQRDKEGGGENIRFVIYDGEVQDAGLLEKIRKVVEPRGGKVLTLDELREIGRKNPAALDKKPTRDDTFCIMYTSGSSGTPKGVVLTHGNIISSLGGTTLLLGPLIRPEDTFLAFLPLSHILEMLVELTFYTFGTLVGYGGVKTLTDASVRKCSGDLKAFKPSIIVGVPTIFETIRKGIAGKINAASPVVQTVFSAAFALKKNVPALGFVSDKVVFSKISEQTGGRLRLAMNGGSALSPGTQEFLSTALVTVLQGYGLTETCGMSAILVPEFYQTKSVGVVVPSIEIKLKDYPDAGYLSTNKLPQGEVLLRGGSVFKGYFKRPDVDKEAFEDGWFRTGDIGEFGPDGCLRLIDRIKNLVKLSSGEYVALEGLESIYKGANILSNLCCYANSDMQKPIGIATLHPSNLQHFLKGQNLPDVDPDADLETLAKNKAVVDAVLKEVNAAGKKGGLKGAEVLSAILLDGEEWTPENGMTTAAQKLNRNVIVKKHQDSIDKLSE